MIKTKPAPNQVNPARSSSPSRTKTRWIYAGTIIGGYVLFVFPNLFFGITRMNGGLQGINLLLMALFQCASVTGLLYGSLRALGKNFRDIGLSFRGWRADALLGLLGGGTWTLLQMAFIIPATGGAEQVGVARIIDTMDGTPTGLLSYIALGVIGGGLTEELFNRGYSINVLKDTFQNPTVGVWVASILSGLLFALGHLPANALAWFDILVPTTMYTLLFLHTKRLTASVVAHGVYNASAIVSIYLMYYPR